jgi:hypothetical protein
MLEQVFKAFTWNGIANEATWSFLLHSRSECKDTKEENTFLWKQRDENWLLPSGKTKLKPFLSSQMIEGEYQALSLSPYSYRA